MPPPLLSDIAGESRFRPPELIDKLPPPSILRLMRDHDWSALRAWRETHSLSRVEVANRLDLTLNTYLLLEEGLVPLCEWTAPFLEARLQIRWSIVWALRRNAPSQHLRPQRRSRTRLKQQDHHR